MNNVVYHLQLGFRQNCSTFHALIRLTDKKREQQSVKILPMEYLLIFKKTFDTVDHDGIRGVANNWFSPYLQNRLYYVSINGFRSNFEHIRCGAPKGSILGPLMLLIYINDLHCEIRY